ncbi:reverse transcriptase domain-containing protein, partial [Tanacetum coccineum]
RDICTSVRIARDVFVPVGKFTFLADFVIVDYKSDPRVPLILGRPFLRTARALIDVHGEEMILRDGKERLILNLRHDTSSYSNKPHQESINMIDVHNVSNEEILKDLFATNHPSGNPISSSHPYLTSPEVNDDIFDPEEDIFENLLNLDKTKDLLPYHDNPLSGNPTLISEPVIKSSSSSPTLTSIKESDLIWGEFEAYLASDSFPPGNSNPSPPLPNFHNSLSGSTTSSSPSLPIYETSDYFLEDFADELAHITFPSGNDDLPVDIESDLREIEYLLNHNPIEEMDSILEDSVDENSLDDNLDDTISEMFTDEHALDYSSPPLWDDYDDEHFDLETINDNTYDDPFDSKEEKIKDSKILIDELDLPGSSDFLPFPECDSVFYEDFSEVDALPSTNNEDKVFNPGILIHENLFEVTNLATMEKNVKKITKAALILEDFNPALYELPFHKEVPGLGALLSFSSENEEEVFNPGILTSKRVHTFLLPELSHRGTKAFKVIKIFESPMEILPFSYGENIPHLDVPSLREDTQYLSMGDFETDIEETDYKINAKTDKIRAGMDKRGKVQSLTAATKAAGFYGLLACIMVRLMMQPGVKVLEVLVRTNEYTLLEFLRVCDYPTASHYCNNGSSPLWFIQPLPGVPRINTTAGNPVKEILLKLNLPDHRSIFTDSKEQIKMEIERRSVKAKELRERCIIKAFKLKNQGKYEHVDPKVASTQDSKTHKMANIDYDWMMISRNSKIAYKAYKSTGILLPQLYTRNYVGTKVEFNGVKYLSLKEDDIVGILDT